MRACQTMVRMGYREATTGSWAWNRHAAAQEGLRLPIDLAEGPDDTEHIQKEEYKQQDADMKVEGEGDAAENVDGDKDGAVTPRGPGEAPVQRARARQETREDLDQVLQCSYRFSAAARRTTLPQAHLD